MSLRFDPDIIERKWQQRWEEVRMHEANLSSGDTATNFYHLVVFARPSNDLHLGHLFAYTGQDVIARFRRARGGNVFFPFGFDSFSPSVENSAREHGMHPKPWAEANIASITTQIRQIGTMIDWSGALATHHAGFYKWTQWLFLQLFKGGLIYRQFGPVDWCPGCQSTLAREQVKGEENLCVECRTPVLKKNLDHWRLRISAYAEDLLHDNGIEW